MLSIAVCDDSQVDINNLINIIHTAEKTFNRSFIISVFTDADSFIKECINAKKLYDLYFLDIYIKNKNGIDLAKSIRLYDLSCKIVFFTSSADYAVESYNVDAFNYIIKPAKQDKIEKLLEECIMLCKSNNGRYILVKQQSSAYPVQLKNISFIESRGRLLYIHTTSHGVLSFYNKLDQMEKEINDSRFLRCHQSFLVNMDYIHFVEENGFKLIGGEEVIIRKIGMQDIKNKFFNYISSCI